MARCERRETAADWSYRDWSTEDCRPVRRWRGLGSGCAELVQKTQDERTDLGHAGKDFDSLIGREERRVRMAACAQVLKLIGPEIKQFLLYDGSANGATKTVVIVTGLLCDDALLDQRLRAEVAGVQVSILAIPECRTVNRVCARLGHDIELPAGELTKFSIEVVLDDAELLHCILDNDTLRPCLDGVIVVHTIKDEAVGSRPIAADRCHGAAHRTTSLCHH